MQRMMRTAVVAVSLVCAAQTPLALADEPAIGAPEIGGDLQSYYGGERRAAFIVGGLGIAAVGSGAVLVTRPNDFARGLGWPLLTLGVLEIAGGVSYVLQVNSEIDRYRAELAADPTAYRADELAHIEGTTRRFVYYRLTELGLTLAGVGLATYGFAAKRPVFEGAGIGCFAVGLPFLLIDTYNNNRAGWYHEQLTRFDPSLQVQAGSGQQPWMLTLSASL